MVSPEFARNTIEALERLQTDLTALTNSQSQNRDDSDKAIKDMKAYVDGMLGHRQYRWLCFAAASLERVGDVGWPIVVDRGQLWYISKV